MPTLSSPEGGHSEPAVPPPSAVDGQPQDPITDSHHEEKHESVPRGYKNVPSLEAITERLAMVRAKSAESTNQHQFPPSTATTAVEAETNDHGQDVEANDDNESRGPASDDSAHPLQHTW